jgi:hypothetical protein
MGFKGGRGYQQKLQRLKKYGGNFWKMNGIGGKEGITASEDVAGSQKFCDDDSIE